jgi:hypothetical protein
MLRAYVCNDHWMGSYYSRAGRDLKKGTRTLTLLLTGDSLGGLRTGLAEALLCGQPPVLAPSKLISNAGFIEPPPGKSCKQREKTRLVNYERKRTTEMGTNTEPPVKGVC